MGKGRSDKHARLLYNTAIYHLDAFQIRSSQKFFPLAELLLDLNIFHQYSEMIQLSRMSNLNPKSFMVSSPEIQMVNWFFATELGLLNYPAIG